MAWALALPKIWYTQAIMSFIVLEDVHFSYTLPDGKALPALRGVSLRIAEGEFVAVVGANGSGKSTLARHLNGLLLPQRGRVTVAGYDTRDRAQRRAIRRLVGMVFQRPEDQLVASTVQDDVAFGLENQALPPALIRARVREALEWVGLWEARARPPLQLSAGQMQRVALAGVLALRPRCIVFDEATAMLDPGGRRAVRALMQRLHAEGVTIITITHFMDEAAEAQRVLVLDRGELVRDDSPQRLFACGETLAPYGLDVPPATALACALRRYVPALPTDVLDLPALVRALTPLKPAAPPPTVAAPPAAPETAPLIEVRALSHTYAADTPLAQPALVEVDLTVAERAGYGLLGATGSGKSTLLQHLNGLLRPQRGRVRVGPYALEDPQLDARVVRRMVGLAFQMPEMQIFEQYVGDEIAYGPRLLGLSKPELRERVRWAMELVGLDFERFKDRLTFALSGGERRKVALASVLALKPAVLALDEPTAGLDPLSRRELLQRLRVLRLAGLTLVLSSHQMEDIAALTERVTVLRQGRVQLAGDVAEVFAQVETLQELGLDVPVVTQLVHGLRAAGWDVPATLFQQEALLNWVARWMGEAKR